MLARVSIQVGDSQLVESHEYNVLDVRIRVHTITGSPKHNIRQKYGYLLTLYFFANTSILGYSCCTSLNAALHCANSFEHALVYLCKKIPEKFIICVFFKRDFDTKFVKLYYKLAFFNILNLSKVFYTKPERKLKSYQR